MCVVAEQQVQSWQLAFTAAIAAEERQVCVCELPNSMLSKMTLKGMNALYVRTEHVRLNTKATCRHPGALRHGMA